MTQKKFGVLVCCASNAVMRPERVKTLILHLEKMGYNLLELCIDDLYKIDGEPYFGYLRGGYTHEEIRDMDAFAQAHGVELVPCIQTLGHLDNLVKHPCYDGIVDIDNILLVDEPDTYALIDKMFASLAGDFTTRCVNIGFDEAHHVGLGRYLDRHGYTDRYDLLLRHLDRVVEIAAKYGFKIHMWSDMFFRLGNHGEYSLKDARLPQSVIDRVPDVELCYWDYYSTDEGLYDSMFSSHERFGKPLWFACAAWTSQGFAPQNHYALKTVAPAMRQCIRHGVDRILVTLWGDNGNDCSYFSALPTLWAARQYADGNFDEADIARGFGETFGVSWDDFMLLDLPNRISTNPDYANPYAACKALLFNDCFLGWKDSAVAALAPTPYRAYAKELSEAAARAGEYRYLFENMAALCEALDGKATLGVDTRAAYQAGDRRALRRLVARYRKTAAAVKHFRRTMQTVWETENKPYGWEVHEVRFGGLLSRLLGCADRLTRYLRGEIGEIPELCETILPYGNNAVDCNVYRALVSVSQL